MEYTLQDIIDAVQYGFDYRAKSQNDGERVPLGNTLQWLMSKKNLMEVPEDFKQLKDTERQREQLCPSCGSIDVEPIVCGDVGCNNCGNIWA